MTWVQPASRARRARVAAAAAVAAAVVVALLSAYHELFPYRGQ